MTKPLPNNRSTLKHLLRVLTKVLAYAEPIRQQLELQWKVIERVGQQDFTDKAFADAVHQALQLRIASGGSDYSVLLDYLDPVPTPDLSKDLAEVRTRLESFPISPTVDQEQWKARVFSNLQKITLVRQQIHSFVREFQLLERKVIEHLERPKELFSVITEETIASVAPDEDEQERPRRKRTKQRKTGQADQTIQPSVSFEKWAIRLNEERCWQIFQRFGSKWCYQRAVKDLPLEGREWTILNAFAEHGGALTRVQLIKLVQPHFSDEEGAKIFKNMITPAMCRLRNRLQQEFSLGEKEPIPWDRHFKGFRPMITVGYSRKDDHHRPQFHSYHELNS